MGQQQHTSPKRINIRIEQPEPTTRTMTVTARPVALVTGSNSGVGLALAVKLASTHRVFASMRGVSAEKRKALDEASEKAGVSANIEVLELDVASDESVKAATEKMLKSTDGRCDVLVNNAGFAAFGSVEMV